jgi:hypothetical protein
MAIFHGTRLVRRLSLRVVVIMGVRGEKGLRCDVFNGDKGVVPMGRVYGAQHGGLSNMGLSNRVVE